MQLWVASPQAKTPPGGNSGASAASGASAGQGSSLSSPSPDKEFQVTVDKILKGNAGALDTTSFLTELENRIARKPGQETWLEAAGILHFQLQDFDQARRALLKIKKPSPNAERLLALTHFEVKEYRKALVYFARLHEVRGNRGDWEKYCEALAAGGSKAEALKEWEGYRTRYAGDAEGQGAGLEFLAEAYRRPLQKDKLVPVLEALLKKDKGQPEEGKLMQELISLYGETHARSLELRAAYLKLHPDDYAAQRGLGAMNEGRGDLKKAIPIYLEVAPQFATDLKFNRHLAVLLSKTDPEKALLFYETCRTLAPRDAEIPLEMARLQEALKRPDMALENYRTVLEINPMSTEAKARLVALAGTRPEPGPWLAAMVENEKKNPKDHAFQFQLAKLFLAAHDRDNAYKYLQKALQNSPNSEEYMALLPQVVASDAQVLKQFALLQRLAAKTTPTPQLMLLLGRGYALYHNQPRAAESFAKVYAESPALLEGHRQPIVELYAAKEYATVANLAEKFMQKNPNDLEVSNMLVTSLSQINAPAPRLRAAIQVLVALEPYDDKWFLKLAQLDLGARDTAAAIQHAREWVKIHPEDKEGHHFLEPLAAKAKDSELYLSTLDNLSRLEPANESQYQLKVGYFFFESGQFSPAVETFTKLTAAFPNDAKFWNRFGLAQTKIGREGATTALEKAYRLEPSNADYARAYANALTSNAELKANLDVLLMLHRQNPTVAERRKLARSFFLNGDYGSSAREWDWFLSADPDQTVADSTAGLAFLRSGQTAKAKPILEKRLAANPRDIDLLATLSDLYGKEGDAKKHIGMMERLVQEDQSHGDYLLRLAREKEKAGQAAEALTLYSQWAFRNQEDQAALKSYHDLAQKQKDTTALIEALRYQTQLKGDNRASRFQLAEVYYARSGETKELEELVKLNPDYRQGKFILVSEYHSKGAWDQLATLEGFLVTESAANADLLEPLADLYLHQKKIAQAQQTYFAWLAVKRKDRNVFDKVYDEARDDKSPNLVAILKMGCEFFPEDLSLMAEYGAALGMTRSGLDAYQALLAKQPGNAEAVAQAAEIAKAIGDRGATAKWAKRWSELKPNEEKPWKYLIEALDPSTEKAKLADAYEGLLRLQSGNTDLILKLARLEEDLGKYDKAIGLYRNALYIDPKDKSVRDKLIALMKDKGKKEDLADVLTEIQSIDSSAHEAQFELAKLYLQKGDKEKAYAYLSTALEQSPLDQNYRRLMPKTISGIQKTMKHFKLMQEVAARPDISQSNPDNADLFLLLGQGYAYQSQWEPAAANLTIAYRLAPQRLVGDRDIIIACYRGKNFALAGELAEKYFVPTRDFDKEIRQIQILSYEKTMKDPAVIRQTLQLLLTMDKENAGGLLRLAELDLRVKDTSAAINNIRNCLTTSPNELRGYKMLLPLVSPARVDQRVTYVVVLEKLAQLDTANRAGYLIRLADFYFDRKNYRQTGKLLSEAVETSAKDAKVWYRLGQCRSHLEVGDIGVSCFQKAYQLEPGNLVYAHTYAQALEKPQDFKANLKLYQFVEDRGPSPHERYGLAMAYFYNGDNVASAKAWDKALAQASEQDKFIPEAALAYLRTTQPAKALPLYKFRLERENSNLGLMDTLCSIYAKLNDETGRVGILENLVRVDATYRDYQLQLAKAKEKARDTVEAINQYGQWTARNTEDTEALKAMHRLAQAKRDTASLEDALRLITKIKGIDPEYVFQLAELQFKFTGDPAELEKLVKAYPLYHRGRIILAKEYYRHYDMAKMIPFEKAMAEESLKDKEVLGPLAELYAYQDKKAPAQKAFRDNLIYRKSLASTPAKSGGLLTAAAAQTQRMIDLRQAFEKAWIYGDANQSPFLVEILDVGNQSFPGEPPIQHALAAALGKDPRALALYKEILDKDPGDLIALRGASELAMDMAKTQGAKTKDAVTWLERWAALEPASTRVWQLLTDAYIQLKDAPKVADALGHWLELVPTDAALAYRAGKAYLAAKNEEKGLEYLIRADELKPKDATYAADLMDLLRTMTEEFLAKGQQSRAVELYGLMLEREPKHKKANLYMGMWLADNKDYGSAEPMLRLGLDQSPEPKPVLAKAWRLMGDCLASGFVPQGSKGGDTRVTALEAYKRALVLDPQDKAASVSRLDLTRALNLDKELPEALADVVRLDSANLEAVQSLGEIKLKEGNFQVAAALYRLVTARAGDKDAVVTGEAWARYGDALEGSKRDPEALAAWEKAYAQGDRTPYSLAGIARIRRQNGTLEKAELPLEDLVSSQPENDEACAWLAELSLRQGHLEKAEEMYAQAAQDAPDKIEYTQGLGEVYLTRGDVESALELLEPLKARLTPEGRLTLADATRLHGKPEIALPIYQEVFAQQPTPRALAGLAEAMLDRNKAADAKRLIEGSPLQNDPEVKLRLGKALLAMRERDKAVSVFEALVKLDKENPTYLFNLGLAHYEQKNLALALKEFKQALEKRPDLAAASYYAGMILLASNQLADARAYFYALAQLVSKPDRALGLRGLAAASQLEKKPGEASDYLVQAVEVFPSPEALAELSQASLLLNRNKEAEEWAQKSLETDEDFPNGIVALAEVMMAENHKEEARDFLKEALNRNPHACEVHLEFAKVNYALENYQGIASNSRQVLTMCPDEPLSYYYAGMVADRSYQKKEAEEYFKYYKKLGGDRSVLPKGY